MLKAYRCAHQPWHAAILIATVCVATVTMETGVLTRWPSDMDSIYLQSTNIHIHHMKNHIIPLISDESVCIWQMREDNYWTNFMFSSTFWKIDSFLQKFELLLNCFAHLSALFMGVMMERLVNKMKNLFKLFRLSTFCPQLYFHYSYNDVITRKQFRHSWSFARGTKLL